MHQSDLQTIAVAVKQMIDNGTVNRKPPQQEHSLNLHCPRCGYMAKTTTDMLERGRLKCPVDRSVLKTKDERGEHRGRPAA